MMAPFSPMSEIKLPNNIGQYLLDTHVLLWMMLESQAVPKHVYDICVQAETVYVSSISAWEITVKYYQRKLSLPLPPETLLPEARMLAELETLPFTEQDVFMLQKLPPIHKDPFDRMLICQAIRHGLTIVTRDPAITQYPVATLW